jgi:hypothetical protein
MRAAARLGLVLVLVGLGACKGEVGAQGAPGAQGPQGDPGPPGPPGDPQTSINNLTGGTIVGDVAVTGNLTAGGHQVLHPRQILAGISPSGCTPKNWNGSAFTAYTGGAIFPAKLPANDPVVVASMDVSSVGANSLRLHRPSSNRVTFKCNDTTDAIHWLAMERGVHDVGGKRIEAGTVPSAGATGTVQFTPPGFGAPPIILLAVDETKGVGTLATRVSSAPSGTGFAYYTNPANTGTTLHWIAMEPGTYTLGRYKWTAGSLNSAACSPNCTLPFPDGASTATDPVVVVTINDATAGGPDRIWFNSTTAQQQVTVSMSGGTAGPAENVFYVVLEDLP